MQRKLISKHAVLFYLITLLTITNITGAAAEPPQMLTVAAIPFRISRSIYASPEAFKKAVNISLNNMEKQAAIQGLKPDLAVFPEYTSAFTALNRLNLSESNPLPEIPELVKALKPANNQLIKIWQEISRERNYSIIAGTALFADSEGKIRNRALLFSPSGELVYSQDKVFPGAPETRILGLKTGRISDVKPFFIKGFTIVLTICRDTYNPEWETALPPAHLWIDIKANELPYTPEYYNKALASRLKNSPTNTGLVVSLQGNMLGYTFTGPCQYLNNGHVKQEILPSESTGPERDQALIIQIPFSKIPELICNSDKGLLNN